MTDPSSYRGRLLAAISRYSPADRDALIAFRRTAYAPASIHCDPSYLSWSFEAAPAARGGRCALWLYRKDGKIEGQQGAVPIALKIGAHRRPAAWNLDLFVNPAFQLRGIGSVLQEVAFEETGLSLGLEVSEDARKAYLRAGWEDLGTVPLFVRPLDARTLFEVRTGITFGPVAGPLADLGNFALRTVDQALIHALALSPLRMERREGFDRAVDALWDAASPSYPVISIRSYESLTWRFDEFPSQQRYRLFYFLKGQRLRGYAVLRLGEWDGVNAGFIVDFLCAPEDTSTLLAHSIAHFREEHAAAIYCLHRNPVSVGAFKALGFVQRDSSWRLMLRVKDADAETRRLLCDPRSWFITLGDSDVDRPREGTVYARPLDWRLGVEG